MSTFANNKIIRHININKTQMSLTNDQVLDQSTIKKFNRPVLTGIDHFWNINRGGFNRLRPPVKTRGGVNHPILSIVRLELSMMDSLLNKLYSFPIWNLMIGSYAYSQNRRQV